MGRNSKPKSLFVDIPELNRWKSVLGWTQSDLAMAADVEPRTIQRMYQHGKVGVKTYAAILESIQRALIERSERIGIREPDYPMTLELEIANNSHGVLEGEDVQHDADTMVLTELQAIEIHLPGELEEFTTGKRDLVIKKIQRILNTEREIEIKSYKQGSVKMTMLLSPAEAEKLYWAIEQGELSDVGVKDSKLLEDEIGDEDSMLFSDEWESRDLDNSTTGFVAKCQKVLQVAKQLQLGNPDWVTFFRETLGVNGAARSVFSSQVEYVQFEQSNEFDEIQKMVAGLRARKAGGGKNEPTRIITVRLPQSLYEALKVEASDHHTSMNKLVIAKLLQVLVEI